MGIGAYTISTMRKTLFATLAFAASVASAQTPPPVAPPVPTEKQFALKSASFENNAALPTECTADGAGTSPPLAWTDAPKATVTFAIMMDDPQARGFVHWIIWNIPATASSLPAAIPQALEVKDPQGAMQGVTSWGKERPGYWGSAPGRGSGQHHYTFTIYALDAQLEMEAGATAKQFKKAIKGHVLASATLVGLYERANHPEPKPAPNPEQAPLPAQAK